MFDYQSLLEIDKYVIKGIINDKHIDEYGMVTSEAFQTKTRELKNDFQEYLETSINIYDEEKAINFSLNQLSSDAQKPLFRFGLLFIPNNKLIILKKQFRGDFDWTREEMECLTTSGVEWNKYHANILLKQKIKRQALILLALNETNILVKRDELE